MRLAVTLLGIAALAPGALSAWQLTPKTLAERVGDADVIVVAKVSTVHSRTQSPIMGVGDAWEVTLRVSKALKGRLPVSSRVTFSEVAVEDWRAFRPYRERVWLLKTSSKPGLFAAPASYESVLALSEVARIQTLLQSQPPPSRSTHP